MSKTLAFTVFCLENYKTQKNITGKEADIVFRTYGIYDYLREFYDVLHTAGYQYIMNDLDMYIRARQAANDSPTCS